MGDFTVAGHQFKCGKMGAFQQFHVARRLAPILGSLKEAFASAGAGKGMTDGELLEVIFEPMANAISRMSDEDAEYVLNACLDTVQMQQGTVWVRIRSGKQMMFDFIGLPEMMQITVAVLQDNFANFFSGLLPQSTPANPA